MKKILVRPNDIERCWEKNDICFVLMKDGKLWLCKQKVFGNAGSDGFMPVYSTLEKILQSQNNDLIDLPLADGGDNYGK